MNPEEFISCAKARAILLSGKNKPSDLQTYIKEIYCAMTDSLVDIETEELISGDDSFNKVVEKVAKTYFPDSDIDSVMKAFYQANETDYCHLLLEKHWNAIPQDIKNLIESGRVGIGLIEEEQPLVQVNHLGNDNYAIILTRGLIRVMYSIIRTLSTLFKLRDEDNPQNHGENRPFEEIVSIMADDLFVLEKTGSISPRKDVDISKEQVRIAVNLCVVAEMFFVFHEYSHILLKNIFTEENIEDITKAEEYMADYFAMSSCFAVNSNMPPDFVYAGCECALLVFSILDKMDLLPRNPLLPTLQERIHSLRNFLKDDISNENSYNTIISFAMIIEEFFNRFAKHIETEPSEYGDFMISKQKSIATKIDGLLNEYCIGDVKKSDEMPDSYWRIAGIQKDETPVVAIPDYEGFNNEMEKLLNLGYYRLLYDKLSKTHTQNLHIIETINSDNKKLCVEEYADYLRLLNKIKLIILFVNSLNEPMATIFKGVAENTV